MCCGSTLSSVGPCACTTHFTLAPSPTWYRQWLKAKFRCMIQLSSMLGSTSIWMPLMSMLSFFHQIPCLARLCARPALWKTRLCLDLRVDQCSVLSFYLHLALVSPCFLIFGLKCQGCHSASVSSVLMRSVTVHEVYLCFFDVRCVNVGDVAVGLIYWAFKV